MENNNTGVADKKEDFLQVDRPVPGQNYTCVSFVSPEDVLPRREQYFFEQFWNSRTRENFESNIGIWDQYKGFLEEHTEKLTLEFSEQNNFQTSIRGLKIRGSYDTEREARIRCEVLQKTDPTHDVFVAPVGYWVPWDANPNNVAEEKYQLEELNELMKNYKLNSEKRDQHYEQQKSERMQKIVEDNNLFNNADEHTPVDASVSEDVPTTTTAPVLESDTSHSDLKTEFEAYKRSIS